MKKLNFIFIIFLLISTLNGCSFENPKYINTSIKPSNHYYTDELKNKILNNETFTLYVFDTNLYKEIEVPSEDNDIIENFISALVDDNYSDDKIDIEEPFRLKIVFNDDKFLINVFNDSVVSISPWDGNYKEDVIKVKDLPLRYNLLDFCNHIANKPLTK